MRPFWYHPSITKPRPEVPMNWPSPRLSPLMEGGEDRLDDLRIGHRVGIKSRRRLFLTHAPVAGSRIATRAR